MYVKRSHTPGSSTGALLLFCLGTAFATVAHAEPPRPPPIATAPKPVVVAHPHVPVAPTVTAAPNTRPAPTIHLPSKEQEEKLEPPPSDAGFAQNGVRATPWGDAKTLAPQSEEKRLWRIANRLNPGYATSGNDKFTENAPAVDQPEARHVNCILASLSFEDSMEGHPTVALPGWGAKHVVQASVEQKKSELGADFAKRYNGNDFSSVLYADRYPNATFEHTDDYHVMEARLAASGPGARMVLRGSWTNGARKGGHAINMVNQRGVVVVVDAQSGNTAKPSSYFANAKWSGFRYFVTAEGAPGKSLFTEADAAGAPN